MPETEQTDSKTLLLILGMHRSGTSVITRCCNLLGIYLGEEFIETNQYNQKGFWEHSDVVSIQEAMLAQIGYGWDDIRAMPKEEALIDSLTDEINKLEILLLKELSHYNLWGVKDPRICRLLPVWNHLVQKHNIHSKALITFRNPLESALSLEKRDYIDRNRALLLWLRYNLDLEEHSRNMPRAFTSYTSVLSDVKQTIEHLAHHANISWPNSIKASESKLHEFVDPRLKNNVMSDDALYSDDTILPLVKECYKLLTLSVEDPHGHHKAFDAIRDELHSISQGFDAAIEVESSKNSAIFRSYAEFQKNHKAVHAGNKKLNAALTEYKNAYNHFMHIDRPKYEEQIQHLKQNEENLLSKHQELMEAYQTINSELESEKKRNDELLNSFSWKITKPLRSLKESLVPSPMKHKENA
ncbi:MAG: hypothetical protein MK137_03170 [Rickettsiales bacterium]|nr:hypothetical protein [Rickettsiales bacterium]